LETRGNLDHRKKARRDRPSGAERRATVRVIFDNSVVIRVASKRLSMHFRRRDIPGDGRVWG